MDNPHAEKFTHVRVTAKDVHKNDDGTFDLVIPSRMLHEEEIVVIESLFPNFGERVHELLTMEALFSNIVKRS